MLGSPLPCCCCRGSVSLHLNCDPPSPFSPPPSRHYGKWASGVRKERGLPSVDSRLLVQHDVANLVVLPVLVLLNLAVSGNRPCELRRFPCSFTCFSPSLVLLLGT